MENTDTLDPWVATRDGSDLYFNATAAALEARGVMFLGPPGSGKSAAALGLMAFGAQLISDDGVWLRQGALMPPDNAPDLIEARGIGLLNSGERCPSARLSLVVVLSEPEDNRLPPRRFAAIPDEKVTLIRSMSMPTLVPAVLQILRHGRAEL